MLKAESVASLTNKEIAALCYQDVKNLVPGLRLGAEPARGGGLHRAPISAANRRTRRRHTVQDLQHGGDGVVNGRRARDHLSAGHDRPGYDHLFCSARVRFRGRRSRLPRKRLPASLGVWRHQRIYTPQFNLL